MSESFTAPGAQKKQLLVVGTVFGVLALAAALVLMLLGGGNSSAAGSVIAANAAAKSKSASASPSGLGAYVIPSQYAGNVGHDPFKPVVVAKVPVASGSSGGAATTSTSSSPSPTKTPVVTLTPTPTPTVIIPTPTATPTATVTVTPSPTGLPTSSTSQTLTLLSVDTAANTINVTVAANGQTTPYTVQNGKVFGTYFKLVSILTDGTTTPPSYGADFQYGDQFLQLNMGQSATLG
jgi:cell division septation protein DedD